MISATNWHAALWRHDGRKIDLGFLPGYEHHSNAEDINNHGDIVGISSRDNGNGEFTPHAFLWRGNRMIDLRTLGGSSSYARKINERGDVVGHSQRADGTFSGVLWRGGRMIELDFYPWDINDLGHIVGYQVDDTAMMHPVLWRNGRLTYLDGVPGPAGVEREAYSINNRDEVFIRVAPFPPDYRAASYLWYDGTYLRLDDIDTGILWGSPNDQGYMLGRRLDTETGQWHLFVRRLGGAYTELTVLPPGVRPGAVNKHWVMTGSITVSGGQQHAAVLLPRHDGEGQ